jgi:CarboxypepD_reg-like domain
MLAFFAFPGASSRFTIVNRLLLVVILCVLSHTLLGQRVIYGTVYDSASSERLPSVNVYINNSTIGTTTDVDGNYSLLVPDTPVDIVFSFVGYRSYIFSTAKFKSDSVRLNVKMAMTTTSLQTVVVRGETDKEWRRMMGRFSAIFLGMKHFASYCSILNAGYIDLESTRIDGIRVLTASSPRPIEILNDALGYKIHYDLQIFLSSSRGDQFTGSVFFVPLKPLDSAQSAFWHLNRQGAYVGSVRHFFKSVIRKELKEEGYSLTIEEGKTSRPLQPDSIGISEVKGIYRIKMPRQVKIEYNDSKFLKEVTTSVMAFPNGYVEVDGMGSIVDPLTIISSGYMGELRVSDMLPFDYLPPARKTETH